MRRRLKMLAIAALVSGSVALGLDSYLLDGIDGLFFSKLALGGEDTQYASGYTDGGFRAIRIGVSKEEVLGILGSPLKLWPDEHEGLEIWGYTSTPSDSNYRIRVVQFRGGVVVDKVSEFYVD